MINLLPPPLKQEYHYARRNVTFVRWLGLFGAGILGLVIISGAGVLYMHRAIDSYSAQTKVAELRLKEQKHTEVEKQVQDISNSLRLAVQVLSKEILFSEMLQQLAAITPSNAVLSGLNITELQGGVNITARTGDYNAATQLQVNLIDPDNMIFSKADIVSITCSGSSTDAMISRYPCTVIIRALFAQNNPFLFINSKAGQ